MEEIREKVIRWADEGGDFGQGLSLFLSFNRNVFYLRNIEAKGAERGGATLLSEFARKVKVSEAELRSRIQKGRECNYKISEPRTEPVREEMPQSLPEVAQERERQKKVIKLREEFPFLSSRSCPDELAILVNQMITAYYEYHEKRELLFEVDLNNLEECYRGAREVIDAYIRNRQIWEELNYYKLHGRILGKLPQFKKRKLVEKFQEMKTLDLVKISCNNIPRKMSYYKNQLNEDTTKNKDEIRKKMAEAEAELEAIKAVLKERGEI